MFNGLEIWLVLLKNVNCLACNNSCQHCLGTKTLFFKHALYKSHSATIFISALAKMHFSLNSSHTASENSSNVNFVPYESLDKMYLLITCNNKTGCLISSHWYFELIHSFLEKINRAIWEKLKEDNDNFG